jgi:hypothetical protein
MATGNLYVMDLLFDVTFAQKSINASLSHQVTLSCVFFSFHGEPGGRTWRQCIENNHLRGGYGMKRSVIFQNTLQIKNTQLYM